jgi:hypothetical protein
MHLHLYWEYRTQDPSRGPVPAYDESSYPITDAGLAAAFADITEREKDPIYFGCEAAVVDREGAEDPEHWCPLCAGPTKLRRHRAQERDLSPDWLAQWEKTKADLLAQAARAGGMPHASRG